MPAKQDDSNPFESILVHFGSDKVRFEAEDLKMGSSMMTVPSAWRFKPLTEIDLKMELPSSRKAARSIKCRGIIVECRPLKKKGRYHVDLLLTRVPAGYANLTQK
jgi:hypothetical protein